MPTAEAIYPKGHRTAIQLKRLGAILEGVSWPSHFSGVARVIAKLYIASWLAKEFDVSSQVIEKRLDKDKLWPKKD